MPLVLVAENAKKHVACASSGTCKPKSKADEL